MRAEELTMALRSYFWCNAKRQVAKISEFYGGEGVAEFILSKLNMPYKASITLTDVKNRHF